MSPWLIALCGLIYFYVSCEQGARGFYNAVARLEKKGRLVKNGGLLYSPALVKKLEARGKPLPDVSSEARRRAGGSGSVVLEVLREHPRGLDGPSLRAAVSAKPGTPESISKHGHYEKDIVPGSQKEVVSQFGCNATSAFGLSPPQL